MLVRKRRGGVTTASSAAGGVDEARLRNVFPRLAVGTVVDECGHEQLRLLDVVGGDLRVGDEVADGDEQHDHEAEEGGDAGVERDGADDRPTPRVEQQAAQRFTLEQGGDLGGELGVGRIGLRERR